MRIRTTLMAVILTAASVLLAAQQVNIAASVPVRSPTGSGVRVGGGLSVPPSARAGAYTGTVTLAIVQVH